MGKHSTPSDGDLTMAEKQLIQSRADEISRTMPDEFPSRYALWTAKQEFDDGELS